MNHLRKGIIFAVVMLMLALSAGGVYASDTRAEGEGFETPEEAILAFAEALQDGDLEKMISTFAVESYCEHFDFAQQIEKMSSLQPFNFFGESGDGILYGSDPAISRLNVGTRYADILTMIKRPLIAIALDRIKYEHPEYKDIVDATVSLRPYSLKEETDLSHEELETLLSEIGKFPDFSETKVFGPYSPLVLSRFDIDYIAAPNLSNIMEEALIAGADGITELGLCLKDYEDDYFITMSIVKYGDKWYNYELGGDIMALLGVDIIRQGILASDRLNPTFFGVSYMDLDSLQADLNADPKKTIEQIVPNLKETETEFNKTHEELLQSIKKEADEKGIVLDPSESMMRQTDALIELSDAEGEHFIRSDKCVLQLMSFDEMLDFFSMEEIKEVMEA